MAVSPWEWQDHGEAIQTWAKGGCVMQPGVSFQLEVESELCTLALCWHLHLPWQRQG